MKDQKKHTVVLGATENPDRYANIAIKRLLKYGHPVSAVGLKQGQVEDVKIQTGEPELNEVDTVTLYIGPKNQPPLYDYILKLKPRRVIFNPGTENYELEKLLDQNGIEPVEACTLVMLSTGEY